MLSIDITSERNPLLVADSVGQFIATGLREQSISLHSAYLLNHDVLRLRRIGYLQSAWGSPLSLSGVLALYMQYLFGLSVGEASAAKTAANWLVDDYSLLKEERPHYIRKMLSRLPAVEPSPEHLNEMSEIRSHYKDLPDDDGPFHTEVFPYDYYSPEDVLLGHLEPAPAEGNVEPDVEELMLGLSAWD